MESVIWLYLPISEGCRNLFPTIDHITPLNTAKGREKNRNNVQHKLFSWLEEAEDELM
jgi:hypothetical protein